MSGTERCEAAGQCRELWNLFPPDGGKEKVEQVSGTERCEAAGQCRELWNLFPPDGGKEKVEQVSGTERCEAARQCREQGIELLTGRGRVFAFHASCELALITISA